jgi:hypothetical protein
MENHKENNWILFWKALQKSAAIMALVISVIVGIFSLGSDRGASANKIDYMQREIDKKADKSEVGLFLGIMGAMDRKLDKMTDKLDKAYSKIDSVNMKIWQNNYSNKR